MELKNSKLDGTLNEYEELVMEIKRELPNIIFPSMGRFEEIGYLDINNKEFIIVNENKEV